MLHRDGIPANRDDALDEPRAIFWRRESNDVPALGFANVSHDKVGKRYLQIKCEAVYEHDVSLEQVRPHRCGRDGVPIRDRRTKKTKAQQKSEKSPVATNPVFHCYAPFLGKLHDNVSELPACLQDRAGADQQALRHVNPAR